MGAQPGDEATGPPVPNPTTEQVVAGLWDVVGAEGRELERLRLVGADPWLPSVFRVGTAALSCVGAATLAAGLLGEERGGPTALAGADLREACTSFRSERLLRVGGAVPADLWAPLSGDYPTGDGWVRLHANFPHHRDAALRALDVPSSALGDGDGGRARVSGTLADRRALDVEAAVTAAGGCAAAMRTRAEWRAHPQAQVLGGEPVVRLRRLGDAPPRRLPTGPARPLADVRVLDLTRVIAGPVCGRVLASHGAEVLQVGAAHLPNFPPLHVDMGFGKRSCHLDLRDRDQAAALEGLAGQADVFVQGYRPGGLAGLGFGSVELATRHPGLVVVNVSAYGERGPWGARRGFDSLVQMVAGIAHEQAAVLGREAPTPLPAQVLDHATGWLAALGALAALRRRSREGGSWVVDVTLAGTAGWLDGLGRVPGGLAAPDPGPADVGDLLEVTDSVFGPVTHVRAVGHLAGSPPGWAGPPVAPGGDPPSFGPSAPAGPSASSGPSARLPGPSGPGRPGATPIERS